jgi:hypothetical protein
MTMKLEQFLTPSQGDNSVIHYVGRFNHLAQYASDHVNFDHKKKACFMRGLNSKIRTMMMTCPNATYHEAVNIAIASEEEYHKHKRVRRRMCPPSFLVATKSARKLFITLLTIPVIHIIHHSSRPGSSYLSVQLQLFHNHDCRMPLAIIPQPRTAATITIPATIMGSRHTSRGSAHIRSSITPTFRKLLQLNSRTRTRTKATTRMPRRARLTRKLGVCSTHRLEQFLRENPS